MYGFRSLLIRNNRELSSDDVNKLCASARPSLDRSRSKGPDFYERKDPDGGSRTVLANELGAIISLPKYSQASKPSHESVYAPAEGARCEKISMELDTYIKASTKPSAPLLRLTRTRLQVLINHMVFSQLMSRRYREYLDFFPSLAKSFPECCVDVKGGKGRVFDNVAVETKMAIEVGSDASDDQDKKTEQVDKAKSSTGSAINTVPSQQIRSLYTATVLKARREEQEMVKKFAFDSIIEQVHEFMLSVEKIVHLNMLVYKDIYAADGMMYGSGSLTKKEMISDQRRRSESHQRLGATEIFYTH